MGDREELFGETGDIVISMPRTEIEAEERAGQMTVQKAESLVVTDVSSCTIAREQALSWTKRAKFIENLLKDAKEKANAAHKAITGTINRVAGPYKQAASIADSKAYAWEKIERERARKEQEEVLKIEREKERQALIVAQNEKLAEAEKLEKEGRLEEATEKLREPIHYEVPHIEIPQAVVPRVSGVSSAEKWEAEVVDFGALVKAVADGRVSLEALSVNQSWLNKRAQLERGDLTIDGVKFSDRGTTRHR